MRVTMILIVTGALGMIPKDLEERLEELEIIRSFETIQITALLRLSRILRKSWRTEETCCHSDSSE